MPRLVRSAILTWMRAVVGAAIWLASCLVAATASAETTEAERARALSLFNEATALLREGRPLEACPKLEEAERWAAGFGIEYTLGDCYEKTARLASASLLFERASATAKALGQDAREKAARERSAALASRLSRLVVEVPPASLVQGLTVTRDGQKLGPEELGVAVPLDEGEHLVRAVAQGFKPWEKTIQLRGESVRSVVVVPPLERESGSAVASASTPPPEPSRRPATELPHLSPTSPSPAGQDVALQGSSPTSPLRTYGWIGLGLGAVGFATGGVLVALAKDKHDASDPLCRPSNRCTPDGAALRNEAVDWANGATAVFVGAGAAAAFGAVMLLIPAAGSQGGARTGVHVAPTVGGAALAFQRAW